MGLNIKNAEVEALARRTAEIEGVSLTEAIRLALQARVTELEARQTADRDAYIAKALEIGRQIRAKIDATGQRFPTQEELDDEMYDEHGLPR